MNDDTEQGGIIMRLGAPVYDYSSPTQWVERHRERNYGAAYFPLTADDPADRILEYVRAAEDAGLVIAEVGAWSNPLSPDPKEREAAMAKNIRALELAERVGARCCVNISGACGKVWDGPDPENLTERTFERIVENTRKIIDAVKPTRTKYTLEGMPWAFPHTPGSYVDLIKAIDRPGFGVHLDVCNWISGYKEYFGNEALIRECFEVLPDIRSIHLKDVHLHPRFTVHIDEVIPGEGELAYPELLRQSAKLGDVCMMIEHLQTQAQYDQAAAYIIKTAMECELAFES